MEQMVRLLGFVARRGQERMFAMDDVFTQAAHYFLIWVGFGTLVGLLAKAIFPGRDPGGALATVIIGVLGSIIGAGTLVYFSDSLRVTPISPVGFAVAIIGTMIILFSYRLLNGNIIREGGFMGRKWRRPRRRISVTEHR
jgi:uncharacterized membrane protein YeaQ/YmgE (transglycosylase-associated protein family)